MAEKINIDQNLLPNRYPEQDFFICDVGDAVLKDVMPQMEHPFYSLSKKPDTAIRRYQKGDHFIEITPSVKGLATIYDKDVLIYCISQVMHKLNRGEKISKRVRLNTADLLVYTNRGTAGKDYQSIVHAIDRLAGTIISTNIRTGDEEQYDSFGLIDSASIRRKHGLNGRLLWCEVTLSDWVFNAISAQEVLTLHRDYFRLRKPIERRIYEIARKHCGSQSSWSIGLENLHAKSGSRSPLREFSRSLRHLIENDHLPDYGISFKDGNNDVILFTNRMTMTKDKLEPSPITLQPETFDAARNVAPDWDIYYLKEEWQSWMVHGGLSTPRDPDKAFIGFCKRWFETRGRPD